MYIIQDKKIIETKKDSLEMEPLTTDVCEFYC